MSRKLRLVGVDLETFWSTEYSLRQMPTPLYIRDQRFKAHLAAVKIDNRPARWVAGGSIQKLIDGIDWTQVILYGHNLIFDGGILSDHYGVVPAFYLDTLGMSRAVIGNHLRNRSLDNVGEYLGLGGKLDGGKALNDTRGIRDLSPEQMERLGGYAVRDIELTYKIAQKLLPQFPKGELPIVDYVTRMTTQPALELDEKLLEDLWEHEKNRKHNLLAALGLDITALRSNDQFAKLLEAEGIPIPKKISKATGKETYAFAKTDREFVELEQCGNEKVAALVQCRLGVKSSIEETRAKHFLDLSRSGLPFPVPLKYSGTHPHRFSGDAGLNTQNLGRASKLRKAIRAPKGHVCIVADSSQIQLRCGAKIAGQDDLVEALATGADPYAEFGMDVFHVPIDKEKKINIPLRTVSKIGVLQCQFQSGPPRFKDAVWTETNKLGTPMILTLEEAKKVVYGFRRKFSKYPECWDLLAEQLAQMASGLAPANLATNPPIEWYADSIVGPSGLSLQYPNLREQWDDDEKKLTYVYDVGGTPTKIYGGLLLQNLALFMEREVITWQTHQILKRYRIYMQGHDEVVLVVPEREADEASKYVRTVMKTSPPWWQDLPVDCDCKVHQVYGLAK